MGSTAAKESAQASAAVEVLQSRVDELGDEAKSAERKISSLNREIAKLRALSVGGGGGGGRRGGGGGGGRGGKGGGGDVISELGKSAAFFGTMIKLLKIPVIIWGIGQLINLIGGLSAGIVGLTGALGPMLGAFAALPGLLSPVVQGFGAVALAVSGVGDALGSYKKAQDAAKDPSWIDAQADAVTAVSRATDEVKKYRAETTRLAKEGTWEEYKSATEAVTAAENQLTDAKERQSDVTRRQNAAQREYEEQMAKMDPSVRSFIETVDSMKPKFEALRKQAQAGLFPGVVDAMKNMEPLFKSLGPIVKLTADVFGDFARSASKMVMSKDWQKDMVPFTTENVSLLQKAGDFLLNIFDAVRNIIMAAAPLTRWFADIAVSAGEWLKDWANLGRASGRFTAFFERTREVLGQVGRIIRNFSGWMMGLFRGGTELGNAMLSTWERATKQFREWTRSAEGQSKIKEFFDSMRPILYETGRLFSGLGRAMGQLWMNSNMQTAQLLKQLRVDLLPALVDLFGVVGSKLGPTLVDLLTSFVKLITQVAEMGGSIMFFFKGLAGVFKMVTSILEHAGPLKDLIVGLLMFVGIWRAFKFMSIITGFGHLAKQVAGVARAMWTLNAATVATKTGMQATMATKFAAWLGGHLLMTLGSVSQAFGKLRLQAGLLRGALAGVATAGLVLTAIAIPIALFNGLNKAKQAAKEFRAEMEKDLDLSNYKDIGTALAKTESEMDVMQEKWDRKYGKGNSVKRFFAGAVQILTPMKNEVLDLSSAINEGGQMTEEYMMKQRLLEMALGPTADAMGLTVQEAQALADKYGVELGPMMDLWNADAKTLAPEIVKIRDALTDVVVEATTFSPAAKAIMDALRGISGTADTAQDRVNALRDVLNNTINPGLDAEKAQMRLDAALGKTTKKVDEQSDAVNNLTSEWQERQKQARADQAQAKAGIATAQAEVDRLKTEGTWDEYMAAKANLDSLRSQEAEAAARIGEPKPLAPKAKKMAVDGVEVAHEAIDAYQEWAMSQYALRGANKEAGESVIADLQAQRGEFKKTLTQAGLNATEITKYLSYFDNIPASVATTVLMDIPDDATKREFFSKYQDELNRFFAANPTLKPTLLAELKLEPRAADIAGLKIGPNGEATYAPNFIGPLPGNAQRAAAKPGLSTEAANSLNAQFPNVRDRSGPLWQAALEEAKRRYPNYETGGIRAPMVTDTPILWGEGRAPEAYIPYDQRYRGRAVGLLSQVARDFGLSVLPRMERGAVRRFEAGGMVPTMAINSIDASIRRMAAGGIQLPGSGGGGGGSTISQHATYDVKVVTVDRPSGQRLGRDVAWALVGARGTAKSA